MTTFERGDRVDVDDAGIGTVTGWRRQSHGAWLVEVELDTGGQWIGDEAWCDDHTDSEPDDGELADRHYERELDYQIGA